MASQTASTTATGGTSSASARKAGLSRQWVWAFPLAALIFLVVSVLILHTSGITDLADAGAVVRWGLPIAETLHNFSMVAVMGSLLFAIGVVPRFADSTRGKNRFNMAHKFSKEQREKNLQRPEYAPFVSLLNFGAAMAVAWTLFAIAVLVFAYADISGRPVSLTSSYTSELISYITTIDAGKQQATTIIIAAVVATLIFGVRSLMGLFLTLAISLIGIIDMALGGHSSGGNDHMGAVNSLGLHLLGVMMWCGGLIALIYISRAISAEDAGTGTIAERVRGGDSLAGRRAPMAVVVVRRYSVLALAGFILVTLSGVINASVRMNNWGELFSTQYGQLVVAKFLFTIILGALGALHRLSLIPAMEKGMVSLTGGLWRVVLCEIVLMGATSGLAVSL
ncbi:MAG: CopD family protein, partial [Rothia sp. (in: high G+C Gram-positive bacteria)]|nr:CopD family protein [Rothia sp. (in: high G+C Gram-positive bacteria)]